MPGEYIKRNVDSQLLAWKDEDGHKPLLLRGARQVGKSRTVRKLAESFNNFVEVNFERDLDAHRLFSGNLHVRKISDELSALFGKPIVPGKTLLFLDEIQSCERAIMSLRYFYEDYPELHVVAAGSLLEFALEKLSSFGVGRIRSVFMYPLSYGEFLTACGEGLLWDMVRGASPENPLAEPLHRKCLDYLKRFLILGGMPSVVAHYVKDERVTASKRTLNDLVTSYKSDFAKYRERAPELHISIAFEAVAEQSGGHFSYSKVRHLNYRQVKEGLDLLHKAGLIIPVVHASATALPLGGQVNPKKTKYLLLDTGIFQRLAGLELSDILLASDISFINRGAIAEQFAGLELIKAVDCYTRADLFFWSREKPGSNAEVDFIIQKNGNIIPIEVKSGSTGKMQSMHLFLNEKKAEYGVRTSLENFSTYKNIRVYPLYALQNIINMDKVINKDFDFY